MFEKIDSRENKLIRILLYTPGLNPSEKMWHT